MRKVVSIQHKFGRPLFSGQLATPSTLYLLGTSLVIIISSTRLNYADDIQLYITLDPKKAFGLNEALKAVYTFPLYSRHQHLGDPLQTETE